MALTDSLRAILRRFPRLHQAAFRLKHGWNSAYVRAFGLGYVARPVTGGPLAGWHFVASRRVYYSPWFWAGTYEAETCRFLASVLPPEAVCYDIGANLGYHALIMARAAPRGHVFAFEPLPQVCAVLRRNLEINRVGHVTIVPKVVARQPGTVTLAKTVEIDQATLTFDPAASHGNRIEMVPCEATTLDAFVREGNPPPTFLKIDVEGAETEVLAGAVEVLRVHRPMILCETHGREPAMAVYEQLKALDYAMYRVAQDVVPITSADQVPLDMNQGHLFARRR